MDNKGRVLLLPDWRRVLEAGNPDQDGDEPPPLIINYGKHLPGYVECYTVAEMEEIEADVEELDEGSLRRDYMEQYILSQQKMVSIDPTNRMVLPSALRDHIDVGNGSEIYIRGRGRSFQIWNAAIYDATEAVRLARFVEEEGAEISPRAILGAARKKRLAQG